MITLTLLHPLQPVPVQSWAFKEESQIRIGRATNNEVVLYSAVVSRHHVEIRKAGQDWEIVNLGANGTYIDGKRVDSIMAQDGMIIRLASSGPKILIKMELDIGEPDSEEEGSVSDESKESIPAIRKGKETMININS